MKFPRRTFLRLAAGASVPAVIRHAGAQTYPSRPVRLIVGAVPGSAPDVIARLIAQSLAERLGQSFVVENRSGASGNLATEAVARAVPDGYTRGTAFPGAPSEFGAFIAAETAKWGKVVKFANLKPE